MPAHMSTPEPSGSPVFVRRLRTCHSCGSQTPVSVPHCWVCHTNLDAKPLNSSQFSIGALLLTMTLVAVVLTVFRFSIASGVVLLAIVVPATVRTIWTVQIWKAGQERMPLSDLLATFARSLGVSVASWIFGLTAFFATGIILRIVGSPPLMLIAIAAGFVTVAYSFLAMRPVA